MAPQRWAIDRDRFLALLLENIDDSLIATDLNGCIIYWNRGAESIFGYSAAEMLGQTPAMLYPTLTAPELTANLTEIVAGNDYVGEWRGRRKDGSDVFVDVTTSAILDAGGNVVGFLGVAKDITERKRMEQERIQLLEREQVARAAAEQAQQHLQRFLTAVIHDMRQPLTSIIGYAQVLQRQRSAVEFEPQLTVIESAARRLRRLTLDLQDAAALGMRSFTVQPRNVDIIDIIHQVIAEQTEASRRRIRLSAPPELVGEWDGDRIGQVVSNLIYNALKYSDAESPVIVHVETCAEQVTLSITDEGIGIGPDQQAQLFQPFSRLDHDEEDDGLGLGLYISKGIVEAHAGTIWLDSQVGVGTAFHVTLPRHSPKAETTEKARQSDTGCS